MRPAEIRQAFVAANGKPLCVSIHWNQARLPTYTLPPKTITGLLTMIEHRGSGELWEVDIEVRPGHRIRQCAFSNYDVFEIVSSPGAYARDTCQTCGDAGEWRSLALVCRNRHGIIL